MIDETWFDQLENALAKLKTPGQFESMFIQLGQAQIAIHLQAQTDFLRFAKVLRPVRPTTKNDFQIFCLTAALAQSLPTIDLSGNQIDRFGNAQFNDGRQMVLSYKELEQLRVIDIERNFAVLVVPDASALYSWDYYSPLKEIFHVWCLFNDKVLLHAGSICSDGKGFLLLGRGGAGKSTATTQAIDMGYQSAGDDYVVVCLKTLSVLNLYRSVKLLVSDEFSLSGALAAERSAFDERNQKNVYMIESNNPILVPSFRLISLLQLERQAVFSMTAMRSSTVLIRLMLSTTLQIPLLFQQQLAAIKKLLMLSSVNLCSLGCTPGTLRESINQLFIEKKELA